MRNETQQTKQLHTLSNPSPLKNSDPHLPLNYANPVGPIMTSFLNPAPQTDASMKEYGLNKPMPFSGDQTKVKVFLQECLAHTDINEDIYTTDKLKTGFVLLYINEKEARDWRELYLENLEDPVTGRLVYPTFGAFLTEVHKALRSADQVQDAM